MAVAATVLQGRRGRTIDWRRRGIDMTFSAHSGGAPSPFDAINGGRLAGWQGSHPLHDVRPEELLNPGNGSLEGQITIEGTAMVGEPIRGTLKLVARKEIKARGAYLRLVGLALREHQMSRTTGTDENRTTEYWVEARGDLFVHDPFLEPRIPTTLAAGEGFEAAFAIPAPALGPPTAHLGEAIVAWALEVRFDIPMAGDAFLATYLHLEQHPHLLSAGVGEQGGLSMLASVDTDGGTISIDSKLPAMPGSTLVVRAVWPSAPGGAARIELHRRSNAPNGINAIILTSDVTGEALAAGAVMVELPLPADLSPSFDGAGLKLWYIVRVLVNRRFRPDAAIERIVAVA
jgi:predicted aconitase with swiveling domain